MIAAFYDGYALVAAEAWMREVQTTPADFLKMKFAIQAAAPAAKPETRQ